MRLISEIPILEAEGNSIALIALIELIAQEISQKQLTECKLFQPDALSSSVSQRWRIFC